MQNEAITQGTRKKYPSPRWLSSTPTMSPEELEAEAIGWIVRGEARGISYAYSRKAGAIYHIESWHKTLLTYAGPNDRAIVNRIGEIVRANARREREQRRSQAA
jgi:hypothetical protein